MSAVLPNFAIDVADTVCGDRCFDRMRQKMIRAARRADKSMTPVNLLTSDERVGIAILADVPVEFTGSRIVTCQKIGICRIGGQYHVYTIPDDNE